MLIVILKHLLLLLLLLKTVWLILIKLKIVLYLSNLLNVNHLLLVLVL